jgi:hypothetical protein
MGIIATDTKAKRLSPHSKPSASISGRMKRGKVAAKTERRKVLAATALAPHVCRK